MATAQTGVLGRCTLDIDRRIQIADDAFVALLGRDVSEVRGELEADFTHHDDRQLNNDRLSKADCGNESFAITKRYVRGDDTVIWVTNHVCVDQSAIGQRRIVITSSLCDPVIPDAVVANWQIANRLMSGFAAGKAIFGPDLFCAAPIEAMFLLYMAESDGRSLTIGDVSGQARSTIDGMSRWVTALAERGLIDIVQQSPMPASTVLRISQACHGKLDELIRKNSS